MPLALDALDRKAEADAVLEEPTAKFGQSAPTWIAGVYAHRGDIDSAFAWLDKAEAYGDVSLSVLHVDPLFEPLHEDARWLPLLSKLNLAPEQLANIRMKVTLPQELDP